jgi:hypothetical protein
MVLTLLLEGLSMPHRQLMRDAIAISDFGFNKFFSTFVDYINNLNPLAIWPMNETSGVSMIDHSGHNLTGTYRDTSMLNKSTFLNNSIVPQWIPANSDYVNMYSTSLSNNFTYTKGTVLLWCKVRASSVWTDATNRTLLDFRTSVSGNIIRFARNATNNRLVATIRIGGVSKTPFFDTPASRNDWFMLAITWSDSANGDSGKIYYNGVQQSTTQTGFGVAGTGVVNSRYANFGSVDNTTPTEFWDGYLGYGALFNKVLTTNQIAGVYAKRFLL